MCPCRMYHETGKMMDLRRKKDGKWRNGDGTIRLASYGITDPFQQIWMSIRCDIYFWCGNKLAFGINMLKDTHSASKLAFIMIRSENS